jgi:hypothetical protein
MTASDKDIDYDELVQSAMRGIVRQVLVQVAKDGLPGDHHFYISFNTRAPGVILSKRLKEKYPDEMTVVLQHRFWELIVTEDRFEVKLTFDSIPERLVVPFRAIRVFLDPSVRFGHQFEDAAAGALDATSPTSDSAANNGRAPRAPAGAKTERKRSASAAAARSKSRQDDAADEAVGDVAEEALPPEKPTHAKPKLVETPAAGPKVVSLDQFRKK